MMKYRYRKKKFRQEYVKRKNIEATSRRSKRIEKRVEDFSDRNFKGINNKDLKPYWPILSQNLSELE